MRAVEDLGGASARSRGRLLVLDEPTPFLPRVGVDQLFGLIRQVVAEGASVIFVSHDISEVMEITDRATVLRDGVLVGVLETRSASHADFVERIVGRSVQLYRGRGMKRRARADRQNRRPVAAGLGPVTLTVGKGEIVGLTGLIGSGFDRVCAAAYGAVPAMRGVLELDRGQSLQSIALPSIAPPRSIDAGVVYLPADRLGAAGVGGLSVVENEMLPMLDRMRGRFGLDRRRMMRAAGKLGAEFNVKPNAPVLPLMALSGGNQQKALMAKWLQTKPQLILLDEPTQGVDVGARQQLLAASTARALRERGSSWPRPTGSNWRRSATASSSSRMGSCGGTDRRRPERGNDRGMLLPLDDPHRVTGWSAVGAPRPTCFGAAP